MVALAITGFMQMIASLFLAAMSYSVYLTLREWSVILYILFCLFISVSSISNKLYYNQYSNGNENELAPLGFFTQIGLQIMAAYYVSRAYYYFRKNGGIHGLAGVNELPEERLMSKAKNLAGKGAEKLDKVLDKDTEKEKLADLEAAQVRAGIN